MIQRNKKKTKGFGSIFRSDFLGNQTEKLTSKENYLQRCECNRAKARDPIEGAAVSGVPTDNTSSSLLVPTVLLVLILFLFFF